MPDDVLKLRDVFTPGGQPSITYVSRDHLNLERRVKQAIAKGFSINVVTGPTKSGKTVLCNHVLAQFGNSISIEGGQIRTEADFWSQISHLLEVGSARTRTESGTVTDQAGAGGKVSIPAVIELSASGSVSGARTTQRAVTYSMNPQRAALDALLANNISLLVDDFHYIPQDAQRGIIQALKGAVFKGLTVILLAVPHRAFDPITVEQEVEGRFQHIEIEPWDSDDLILIPERGFAALNINASSDLNKAICADGFGNPLLVQEICSELCIKSDIYEWSRQPQRLDENLLPPSAS